MAPTYAVPGLFVLSLPRDFQRSRVNISPMRENSHNLFNFISLSGSARVSVSFFIVDEFFQTSHKMKLSLN